MSRCAVTWRGRLASDFFLRSRWCYGERNVKSHRAELPRALLERIVGVLQSHKVHDAAFTGAVAVGVWAAPRQTKDLDLCGSLPSEEVDRLLALRDGIRSGAEALPDIVRFRVDDWDVDLFVSKGAYDRECLRRALAVEIDGVNVRVVTPEDLLLHKMIKLRHDRKRLLQDLADIRAVLETQGARLDWEYLRRWALPEEWGWLKGVQCSTDEQLVRHLPKRNA